MTEMEIYFCIQNIIAYVGIAFLFITVLYLIILLLCAKFNKRK